MEVSLRVHEMSLHYLDNDRQGLPPQHGGYQGRLSQRGGQLDASRDVSPQADMDKGRQGLLPQHEGHPDGPHDAFPLPDADDDRQGLSLNGEVNTFTESRRGDSRGDRRGDRRRKEGHATMQHCACAQCRTSDL